MSSVTPQQTTIKPVLILAGVLITAPLLAEEFVTYANVIRVDPIVTTRTAEVTFTGCTTSRPTSNSLVDLLRWDIECALPETRTVEETSYQVVYEFEGETFMTQMKEYPGETLPIRVSLR